MLYQFLAHKPASRTRVFALVRAANDHLEAVTTLSTADAAVTDDLVIALNTYLATRDDEPLLKVLDRLPDAVRIAVQNFIRDHCTFELGAFTSYGPIDTIRTCYFSRADDEFVQYLDAAYMIGLGIRVTNELTDTGDVDWGVELLTDEVFVPANGEPRTWPLPNGIPVLRTWTSRGSGGNPVIDAVDVARKASDDGHWVRLHSLTWCDGETEVNSTATSEFVVDVFDAPIPPESHEVCDSVRGRRPLA